MDSKDLFEKWTPIDNLKRAYDVDGIYWETSGLSFVLVMDDRMSTVDDIQKLKFTWNSSNLISYHVTDETYRADCWELDFENNGRFYICNESQYLEKFREKSPLFPDNVIHFVLVGTNTIVDVLAKDYPKVQKVQQR